MSPLFVQRTRRGPLAPSPPAPATTRAVYRPQGGGPHGPSPPPPAPPRAPRRGARPPVLGAQISLLRRLRSCLNNARTSVPRLAPRRRRPMAAARAAVVTWRAGASCGGGASGGACAAKRGGGGEGAGAGAGQGAGARGGRRKGERAETSEEGDGEASAGLRRPCRPKATRGRAPRRPGSGAPARATPCPRDAPRHGGPWTGPRKAPPPPPAHLQVGGRGAGRRGGTREPSGAGRRARARAATAGAGTREGALTFFLHFSRLRGEGDG